MKISMTKRYPGEGAGLYRPTGEFRPPRKGEFYLSGAIISAYKAPNDLSARYYIAVRVDERGGR